MNTITENIPIQEVKQLYDSLSEPNRQTIDAITHIMNVSNGTRQALKEFNQALESLTSAMTVNQILRKED